MKNLLQLQQRMVSEQTDLLQLVQRQEARYQELLKAKGETDREMCALQSLCASQEAQIA